MKIELKITPKQEEFIHATEAEVLYGGAAGGGKSYGQLIDALLFALKYPKSRQLILRRTFPELKRSLILKSWEIFPKSIAYYRETLKSWKFIGGSVIEFGYCDMDTDVYQYQSAEYDVIRFDELTHFTEFQYTYLISRVRGVNDYPKQIKSTTNPGGVGHTWVKKRFIDGKHKNRIFIPARIVDNKFLMQADPAYIKRLEQLGENERRALLYGEWELDFGQYFPELERQIHITPPMEILPDYRKYVCMDYGFDCFACYWIYLDREGFAHVYRERYLERLIVSEAAREILEASGQEEIFAYLAPDDLFSHDNTSGKSPADIFAEYGIILTATNRSRIPGWYALKEWLKPINQKNVITGQEYKTARLTIFDGAAPNLWHSLTHIMHSDKNPNDAANNPHGLTHAPDALRTFAVYWIASGGKTYEYDRSHWSSDMWEDYEKATIKEKNFLDELWKIK